MLAFGSFCAAAAPAQFGPQPVAVAPILERDIPAMSRVVGSVLADKRALVASEVMGIVAALPLVEGQYVKTGEVLCRLDQENARLRLDQENATLGALQARLQELEAGTREEQLRRQQATVEEAEAILNKWRQERDRILDIFARGQSNEKERRDTEMETLAAERRVAQSRAEFDMWKNGPRAEEIAKARFDVGAQRAIAQRAARELAKTEITAPFDGFVASKRTEVGEWIEAGRPVCEMVALDLVKIRVDVPESAITFARPGQPALVEVESIGRTIQATIARLIPLAAAQARTFPIEIDVPNADHALLPGMFVRAGVPSGPPGKRLMVPKDAVVARGLLKQIFVVRPGENDSKMAIPTNVTTGLESAGLIEVQADGLHAGDQVVVRANERLYGPTPILLLPQSAPPASAPAAPEAAK